VLSTERSRYGNEQRRDGGAFINFEIEEKEN
jgi:hypothetical protein